MSFASDQDKAELGVGQSRSSESPSNPNSSTSTVVESPSSSPPETPKPRFDVKEFRRNCYYIDDWNEKHAKKRGFAQIARVMMLFDNMDISRDYRELGRRLMLYAGGRISYLQKLLRELDDNDTSPDSLTANQTRPPGTPEIMDDFKDRLFKDLNHELLEYSNMIGLTADQIRDRLGHGESRQDRYLVPPRQLIDFLKHIAGNQMLNKEECGYFDELEDFSTTNRQRPKWAQWLIYSSVGQWLIGKLSPKADSSCSSSNSPHLVRDTELDTVFFVLYILITGLLILTPVGIMMLNVLSQGAKFGVIVSFFLLIATFTYSFYDIKGTIVAEAAYLAIMIQVTSL
ncbi:hypothetical protein QBC38DRAFT_447269 [Podospora fimiseda]|uniref:DUF6594 domain-containing protein n=1 Tax=Podospora fimiseda TaxID=252190 RepID=A0AAN7BHT8_9PEZI|nr:hypothetical protein QBC38DRAFT_447269 [Podospora fimiseda]